MLLFLGHGHDGIKHIQAHPFFASIDWEVPIIYCTMHILFPLLSHVIMLFWKSLFIYKYVRISKFVFYDANSVLALGKN